LDNPQAHLQEVLDVFAKLVEVTMSVTREEMSQPAFEGLNVLNYAQLHEDSLPELAFFRAVSKMMAASCVDDFCFNDLLAPTKLRLRRHLSAVINFCMFREGRMQVGVLTNTPVLMVLPVLVLQVQILSVCERSVYTMHSVDTRHTRLL
jgi:Nuf2 family